MECIITIVEYYDVAYNSEVPEQGFADVNNRFLIVNRLATYR